MTVLWSLTVVSSLAAEAGALVCSAAAQTQAARTIAGGLLLAALVTGLLCLLLTPVVWWLPRTRPPVPLVLFGVLVGIAPVVTLVILSVLA